MVAAENFMVRPMNKQNPIQEKDMKYTYKIMPGKNLVIETFKGKIFKKDLIDAASKLMIDSEYKCQMNVISDFRNAEIELSVNEVHEFANWMCENASVNSIAIVVGRVLDFGMSRMFEMLTDSEFYNDSCVFYDLDEAEKWIETKNPSRIAS
jgi:hypothetical protein